MGNFLKELFIDEVKGCLISDVGGYDTNGDGVIDNAAQLGGVAADQYALKTDIPTYTMSATDDGNGNVTISIGG